MRTNGHEKPSMAMDSKVGGGISREDEDELEQDIDFSDMIHDPMRLYLREIGGVRLLKAKDERTLARSMECGTQIKSLEKA